MENTVKKIYADLNGVATFVCENCGQVKKEPAAIYKEVKGPITIDCPCGQPYQVEVEFRKFYRKETRLDGIYMPASSPGDFGKIIVKNVSLGGCGFETLTANMLHPDEEIKIEFRLNDMKNTIIKKKAVVRVINGRYIGCKFKELPGAFDPDLGYYLRKT